MVDSASLIAKLYERVHQIVRAADKPYGDEAALAAAKASYSELKAWLDRSDEAIAADVRAHGAVQLSPDMRSADVWIPFPVAIPDEGAWLFELWAAAAINTDRGFSLEIYDDGKRCFDRIIVEPDAPAAIREARDELIEAARVAGGYYEALTLAPVLAAKVKEYVADVERVLRDIEKSDVGATCVSIPIPGTEATAVARAMAIDLIDEDALYPGQSAKVAEGYDSGPMRLLLYDKQRLERR